MFISGEEKICGYVCVALCVCVFFCVLACAGERFDFDFDFVLLVLGGPPSSSLGPLASHSKHF